MADMADYVLSLMRRSLMSFDDDTWMVWADELSQTIQSLPKGMIVVPYKHGMIRLVNDATAGPRVEIVGPDLTAKMTIPRFVEFIRSLPPSRLVELLEAP